MSIFEKATRQKIRFPSQKGELTVEQLWDLPLTSRNSFDLDVVAKEVNRQLKDADEESFVSTKANPKKDALELKLEVVKHVIATKLAEAEEAKNKSAKAEERRRLTEVLHNKQNAALENLTEAQIQERLAALKEE